MNVNKPIVPTTAPHEEWQAVKSDLEIGLADVASGRVQPFDTARIVAQGRKLLAAARTRP